MPFDFEILYYIQEHIVNPTLDKAMMFASALGDYGFIWLVIAIALMLFKKTRTCGILIMCSLAFCFITGEIITKNLVCRVRPCYQDMTINMLVDRPNSYSFPSGHSSSSFTAASTLFYYNRKIGALALLLAGFIAFSRMYLFVHFPTDVFAGILWGIVGSVIVLVIYKRFFNNGHIELI